MWQKAANIHKHDDYDDILDRDTFYLHFNNFKVNFSSFSFEFVVKTFINFKQIFSDFSFSCTVWRRVEVAWHYYL